METNNSTTNVQWTKCPFRGKEILYTDGRIEKDVIPDGLFIYQCRHGDDGDFVSPVTIEQHVLVNFAGTILSVEELELGEYSTVELTDEESDQIGWGGQPFTIEEYVKQYVTNDDTNHKGRDKDE